MVFVISTNTAIIRLSLKHILRIDSYDFDQLMLNDKQVGWILINSRRSILAITTIETK